MLALKKLVIQKRKMIKTEFHYTEEEIKDFFRFQLLIKEKTKWIYFLSLVFFVLIGALLTFKFKEPFLGLLTIIIAIIFLLIFPLQVNKTLNKQAKSRYKRAKQTLIFGYDITQYVEEETITYQWKNIIEVNETNKYLYFYLSKKAALIVNKEMLESEDYNSLIKMVKDKNININRYNFK